MSIIIVTSVVIWYYFLPYIQLQKYWSLHFGMNVRKTNALSTAIHRYGGNGWKGRRNSWVWIPRREGDGGGRGGGTSPPHFPCLQVSWNETLPHNGLQNIGQHPLTKWRENGWIRGMEITMVSIWKKTEETKSEDAYWYMYSCIAWTDLRGNKKNEERLTIQD